ncbi:MAG: hypothetical protein L3J59_13725 [Methylococcaceae bacterium]|nr:hypothetical protein [Methylococcaceae bacterium]
MIELNSITVVLLVEALIVLLLLILIFLMVYRSRSSANHTAVHKLINKLEKDDNYKTKDLEKVFTESCGLNPGLSEEIINEISIKERKLYKQIVKIFFNRDIKLLAKVDQYINSLSEPYVSLIRHSEVNNQAETKEIEFTKSKINSLEQENDFLREKVAAATDTMKEISDEYMRVFRGTQTELELRKSSIKMFQIFRETKKRIETPVNNLEIEEL